MIFLLAAIAAWVLVDVVEISRIIPIYRYSKKKKQVRALLQFKPFTCSTCMAGWLTVPLCLYFNTDWILIPYYMTVSMVVVILLNSLMNKIS